MLSLGIYKLHTTTQSYDWGSTRFFSDLRGEEQESAEPEAELWVGVHPKAPSEVELGGVTTPLSDLIDARPVEVLGTKVVDRFGDRLPFLLKILVIEKPLSIQLHPDRVQARHGSDRQARSSLPEDELDYVDPRHKPELAVALTPFSALRGLRSAAEIVENFGRAEVRSVMPLVEDLEANPHDDGIKRFVQRIFSLGEEGVSAALKQASEAIRSNAGDPIFEWIGRLIDLHPEDAGCLAPLMMNLEVLEPGQAIFQPPGMLHCYLEGAAVEVMADSDNVLRAGLTTKHRDLRELLKLLVIQPFDTNPVEAHERGVNLWTYYPPVEEFNLSRLQLLKGFVFTSSGGRSVELWVCTEGGGRMWTEDGPFSIDFLGGDALLVPAGVDSFSVEGEGCMYFAGVP